MSCHVPVIKGVKIIDVYPQKNNLVTPVIENKLLNRDFPLFIWLTRRGK